MNSLPPDDSVMCPDCNTHVMDGNRFCHVCGRAMPFAGMSKSLLLPEQHALNMLQNDISIDLDHPPAPLQLIKLSLQSSIFDRQIKFYYVPQTGHFYAVQSTTDRGKITRSWAALDKSELLCIMRTLDKNEEYYHICSLPKDASPDWKPIRHDPKQAHGDQALPEIPKAPATQAEAQALEEAVLQAFQDIDWEKEGHEKPIPGAILIWDEVYYVPAIRKFYNVTSGGNYYHGYSSDIRPCPKYFLLNRMIFDILRFGTRDIQSSLKYILSECSLFWFVAQLPEGFNTEK